MALDWQVIPICCGALLLRNIISLRQLSGAAREVLDDRSWRKSRPLADSGLIPLNSRSEFRSTVPPGDFSFRDIAQGGHHNAE